MLTIPSQRKSAAMDLDTFLVALYTIVDDLYQANIAPLLPQRCGPKPRLSGSEMLTLALCAQWYGTSERAFLRYAAQHWRGYFPALTTQSACNRRFRNLAWALGALAQESARQLRAYAAPYQVVDTVPVPLMRRCRGQKHKLFGVEADIGRGDADRDWYYGCKLMLAATDQGVITGFLLSPASTEDHWAAEAFFCWRANPQGYSGMPGGTAGPPQRTQARGAQWSAVAPLRAGASVRRTFPGRQRLLRSRLADALAPRVRRGGAGAKQLPQGDCKGLAAEAPLAVAGGGDGQRAAGTGLPSAFPQGPQPLGAADPGVGQDSGSEPGHLDEPDIWPP